MGERGSHADDLMPSVSRRGLPDDVRRNREQQAAADDRARQLYEPRVDAHIAAHAMAVDFLERSHQWLADELDFDLVGDTRPAAVWQMAGRCIGIARLVLDALRLGYTAEVLHLARELHEASRLAEVFGMPDEEELLRTWLAGEWVRPKAVREAERRFEERLAEAMREMGVPELRRTGDLTKEIYADQSEAAHHRRRWTQDAVTPQLRTMIRGRTSRWMRRAATTAAMLAVVEETVMAVGDALSRFFGPGWYEANLKPFLASFEALRASQPLP